MSEEIPAWIANLALDVYKVIQKYNAMPRFQQMINEWAEEHEAEIEKNKEWDSERHRHFEERVSQDPRLQNEEAGPPGKGWRFETHVLHPYKKTASGTEHPATMVSGWIPPELSVSAEPKFAYILPLSRDHELNLPEKYTLLAAIYDVGRQGTEEIKLWAWPSPDKWDAPNALSNAKRCLFLKCLCDSVSKIAQDDDYWLKAFLTTVEEDLAEWAGMQAPHLKEQPDKASSETRVERFLRRAKDHPLLSVVIIAGLGIIALGTVAVSINGIMVLYDRITGQAQKNRIQMGRIEDKLIVTAIAIVDVTIMSEEKGKTNYITPGTYMAFIKAKEPLLVMSSMECKSEQTSKNSVRYTSKMSIDVTSKALNLPLSLLKQTEYVEVRLKPIRAKSYVLSGKALCVFNGNIPIEIQIPSQEMTGEIITVRDVHIAFTETP